MAINTSATYPGWNPDKVSEIDIEQAMPELHLVSMTTKADEIEGDAPAVRVPFVSVDPAASVVAEGATIAPTDPTLAEVTITTEKTAVLVKVSREMISQQNARGRFLESVQRGVRAKSNADFMASLATASVSFVDGGALGSENLDALADLLTDMVGNGASPSHIVMRSADWKAVSAIKTSTGSNVPLVGIGDTAGSADAPLVRRLFGVPVVVTNDLPAGDNAGTPAPNSIVVVSPPDLVSAYGSLMVAASEDLYFDSDSLAIRATLRYGIKQSRNTRAGVLSGVTEGA